MSGPGPRYWGKPGDKMVRPASNWLSLLALLAVADVIGAGPWLLWSSLLPDQVATQWSSQGWEGVTCVDRGHALVWAVAPLLALSGVVFAAQREQWLGPRTFVAPLGAALVGLVAFTSLSIFLANLDVADCRAADLTPLGLALPLVGILVFGAAGVRSAAK